MTTEETSNKEVDEQLSDEEPMTTGQQEPIRKCPYCGEEKKSRGLFAHVMNSNGNGHGPFREVPDDFEQSETEIVGAEEVDKRDTISGSESGNEIILCTICGNTSKGTHGFNIHARKMSGKNNHPEDPTDITDDQIRAIPADEHWNPVGSSVERELDDEYKEMLEWENDTHDNESEKTQEGMFIPVDELRELQDMLIQSREKQPVIDELERIIQRYS